MNFEDLKNPELQEKLKSATTPEEILAIAKEEGFELADEELQQVAGGKGSWKKEDLGPFCPHCGSSAVWIDDKDIGHCQLCGYRGPRSTLRETMD